MIERMYTRILTELSINRFKWTGLEGTGIDPRFLELTLHRYGLAVVFEAPKVGRIVAAQGTPNGQLNWIQDPTAYNVILFPHPGFTISSKLAIPIWANYLRHPDHDIIRIYAQRLAELDRSLEINAKNARRTRFAFVNENQRLSVSNINRQIDEGQELIQVNSDQYDGASLADAIQSIDLSVHPDLLEKLHIYRTRVWGEVMGLLGFDFANQDKKERLVASEVDANNSQVDGMRAVNLNARREAADKINKKFGTKLAVEYHITSETSAAAIAEPPSLSPATMSPVATQDN